MPDPQIVIVTFFCMAFGAAVGVIMGYWLVRRAIVVQLGGLVDSMQKLSNLFNQEAANNVEFSRHALEFSKSLQNLMVK